MQAVTQFILNHLGGTAATDDDLGTVPHGFGGNLHAGAEIAAPYFGRIDVSLDDFRGLDGKTLEGGDEGYGLGRHFGDSLLSNEI
jgi:hypothetical protein